MAMNDLISDLIARIRNAQRVNKSVVSCLHSNLSCALLDVLREEGYIRGYKISSEREGVENIIVELKYFEGKPAIQEIKRLSKPGLRSYVSIKDLKKMRNPLGLIVLSTSKGVLSDEQAFEMKAGGELLCSVF